MCEDGRVMSRQPTHGRGLIITRWPARPRRHHGAPGEEREHASALQAHFNEAQDEQALWQEFQGHDASLNNALNEALQIHIGPTWRVFQVRVSY
jgi:hypothetical protein